MNVKTVKYNKQTNSIEVVESKQKTEKTEKASLDDTYSDIRNHKKIKFLMDNGFELHKYSKKLVKILIDGDYNKELKNYKSEALRFVSEILDKKIRYTKLGNNHILYKLIQAVKKGEIKFDTQERKPRRTRALPKRKVIEEQDDDDDDEEQEPEMSTTDMIKQLIATGNRNEAVRLLHTLDVDSSDFHYLSFMLMNS